MDHHGEFSPDDPEWNAQARLEEAIADFCQDKFKKAPRRNPDQRTRSPSSETLAANKVGNLVSDLFRPFPSDISRSISHLTPSWAVAGPPRGVVGQALARDLRSPSNARGDRPMSLEIVSAIAELRERVQRLERLRTRSSRGRVNQRRAAEYLGRSREFLRQLHLRGEGPASRCRRVLQPRRFRRMGGAGHFLSSSVTKGAGPRPAGNSRRLIKTGPRLN